MSPDDRGQFQPMFVDAFEVRYFGRALRRHGWVIALCAVLGGIVGAWWSLQSPRVYQAEAVLLVNIHILRYGPDGVPNEVELIIPTRRLVGTLCISDEAMELLAHRFFSDPDPTEEELVQRVNYLRANLYYDQRSQELSVLRAIANKPGLASKLANDWAIVSHGLLRRAYGTTTEHIERIDEQRRQARGEVLKAHEALARIEQGADYALRLERTDAVDRAQRLLGQLNQRRAELMVRFQDSEEIARIVSEARPPAKPVNTSTNLVAGLFAFAGLLLGAAISLMRLPHRQA